MYYLKKYANLDAKSYYENDRLYYIPSLISCTIFPCNRKVIIAPIQPIRLLFELNKTTLKLQQTRLYIFVRQINDIVRKLQKINAPEYVF